MKTIKTLFPLSREELLLLQPQKCIQTADDTTVGNDIVLVPKKKPQKKSDSHAFEAFFHYQITEEGAEINGFHPTAYTDQPEQKLSQLSIPAQLDSYPVISIGEHAFDAITQEIQSVDIPSFVKNIHPKAFLHCTHLSALRVDENNPYFCTEEGILFSKDKRELLCYPKYGNKNVYQIPDCVEHIGSYAFAYADGLRTVSMHDNVLSIKNHAFYHSNLKEIIISDSVQTIGEYAFCSSRITTIRLPSRLTELSKGMFKYCSLLKNITVPDEVTVIQEGAFQKCSQLDMIVLPEQLNTIGENAFEGCRSLMNIDIPTHMVHIGDHAFMNCIRLFRVTLPSTVYEIGKDVFENCPADIITVTEEKNKNAAVPAESAGSSVKSNHKKTYILIAVLLAAALLLAIIVLKFLFHSDSDASFSTGKTTQESSISNKADDIKKDDFFALPYNGIAVINSEKKVNISYVEDIEWVKVDEAKNWSNVAALSTGYKNLFGLCYDGTVVATGSNEYGQCNVSDWKDVVLVDAGYEHTAALKSDGTVYAVGKNTDQRCNVQNWDHLIYISAGRSNTVGLKDDGTVLVTGGNEWHQSEINDWHDMKMISAGYYHTVGLQSDGTVIAQGDNKYGQCNVENWKDIAAVFAGKMHTVALKQDGTVVATGHNDYGQCNVSDWKDVTELYVEKNYTVGKTSSGELLITGLCFYDDEISERKYYLEDYRAQLTP